MKEKYARTWYYLIFGIIGCGIFGILLSAGFAWPLIMNILKFNIYQLLWCIVFAGLGFCLYGLQFRKNDLRSIRWAEPIFDVITLLAVTVLVYVYSNTQQFNDSPSLFYLLSGALSFIGGYISNRFWVFIDKKLGG